MQPKYARCVVSDCEATQLKRITGSANIMPDKCIIIGVVIENDI